MEYLENNKGQTNSHPIYKCSIKRSSLLILVKEFQILRDLGLLT